MLSEKKFGELMDKSKKFKYSSMNYIEYEDCARADILYERDGLILLKENSLPLIHFAADNSRALVETLAQISGELRLHFVPKEFVTELKSIGFIEWSEYIDFWNKNLAATAEEFSLTGKTEFLNKSECENVSLLSRRCALQSRGFEGESAEWFAEWLNGNEVIIQRNRTDITGFCCVSIYNEGTTLWIREIAVDPAYQGKGIGKKLMEHALRYGVDNKAVKSFLAADLLNKNAIGLYKKYGFDTNQAGSELQMIKQNKQNGIVGTI